MSAKCFMLFIICLMLWSVSNAQDSMSGDSGIDYKSLFARNEVSVVPFIVCEKGKGWGLQYEHFIGESGKLSFYIPAYLVYNSTDVSDDTPPHATGGVHTVQNHMSYIMPGIKYYPRTCYHFFSYAIGASIVAGTGRVGSVEYGTPMTHSPLGFIIHNTVNCTVSKRVYFGLQAGLGLDMVSQVNEQDIPLFGNLSVSLGYRFKG